LSGDIVLIALIIVGVVARSTVLATASSVLLILKLMGLTRLFPVIERRGLEIGLLFLMLSVLVPLIDGRIQLREFTRSFTSVAGLCAIAGGMLATYLNGQGLSLLKGDPELMMGLVIGSIFGIIFFKGIPVGPLMAAALAAMMIRSVGWFR